MNGVIDKGQQKLLYDRESLRFYYYFIANVFKLREDFWYYLINGINGKHTLLDKQKSVSSSLDELYNCRGDRYAVWT